MIFDSHAHYDDKAFDEDREEVLKQIRENGVDRVVNVGASLSSCERTIELVNQYSFMYGALGIHPSDTGELSITDLEWLKNQTKHPKIVAIGEIGLDYYWPTPEHDIQKEWFQKQLELASETKLPVIIHSRDAAKDTLDILTQWKKDVNAVIHCFSYAGEVATQYLDMGYYIGIGGVLTFKNAKKMIEVAQMVPLDRILLETDCPYLSPEPFRGKRNQSDRILQVADKLAEIKGISREIIIAQTEENAEKFYQLNR